MNVLHNNTKLLSLSAVCIRWDWCAFQCYLCRFHLHPLREPDGHLSAYPARHSFNLKESFVLLKHSGHNARDFLRFANIISSNSFLPVAFQAFDMVHMQFIYIYSYGRTERIYVPCKIILDKFYFLIYNISNRKSDRLSVSKLNRYKLRKEDGNGTNYCDY